MPIIGVTDQHRESDFPGGLSIMGKVWRGLPKPDKGIGEDLKDLFRVEFYDKRWEEEFLKHYGTLTPNHLNILLPFKTVERVFETWFVAFSAQGFKHKCNGQRILEKMVGEEYKLRGDSKIHYQKKKVNEPCLRGSNPVCAECGDKGSGLFTFYIRELFSAGAGSTKGFRMSVGGRNDVPEFTKQLANLEAAYGSLSGSPFSYPETYGFIPYVLTRVPTPTTKPIVAKQQVGGKNQYHHTGGRTQSEYWALQISEDPEWLSMLQRFYKEQEIRRIAGVPELAKLYGYDPIVLPAIAPTQPQIAALPAEIVDPPRFTASLRDRLSAVRAFTGHNGEQITTICSNTGVTAEEAIAKFDAFLILFRAMLIDFGLRYEVWTHNRHCENSFDKLLAEFPEDPNETDLEADERLMGTWLNKLELKQAEKSSG